MHSIAPTRKYIYIYFKKNNETGHKEFITLYYCYIELFTRKI